MAERIVFTGKQEVELETFTPPKVEANQVGVRALCSLMSTGTENICFNRLFEEGSHWDNWVKYPFYTGYCFIGEVDEVGAEVETLKVGDRVALRKGHASYHVVNAKDCVPVPDGVDSKDATWFALAKITFIGAYKANYRLGESTLIIGAGPIGQAYMRWANATGAEPVIVLDPVEKRLQHARDGGILNTLCLSVDACRDEVSRLTGGKMPAVVVDTTGNAAVLPMALDLAGDQGRVILVGDTGSPTQQHLTQSVLRRGLWITGIHDSHNTPEWNDSTIPGLFFRMLLSGRINVRGLNTHEFKPAECKLAYRTANEKRGETMGIIFDWSA